VTPDEKADRPRLDGPVPGTAPAKSDDLTEMTDAERAQFARGFRGLLMEKTPKSFLEAVNTLRQREPKRRAQADFRWYLQCSGVFDQDGYSYWSAAT